MGRSMETRRWLDRPYWIFDMDGTLTVPAHDFEGFKKTHGLAPDRDLLSSIEALSEPRRSEVQAAVRRWEVQIVGEAASMPDAVALLDALVARGAQLGILTRNSKPGAVSTLQTAGLSTYFVDEEVVLGRFCAAPKPSPEGIHRILGRWGARPQDAVMVGDWVYDVQAGRAAGTATVLINRHGPVPSEWGEFSDVVVDSLVELIDG
jgi:HAD superfamily hydrolase (TIGR01509 family)